MVVFYVFTWKSRSYITTDTQLLTQFNSGKFHACCTSVFVLCTHMWGCVCTCVGNESNGLLVALGFGLEQIKFLSS